jgi:hypothetical protein
VPAYRPTVCARDQQARLDGGKKGGKRARPSRDALQVYIDGWAASKALIPDGMSGRSLTGSGIQIPRIGRRSVAADDAVQRTRFPAPR